MSNRKIKGSERPGAVLSTGMPSDALYLLSGRVFVKMEEFYFLFLQLEKAALRKKAAFFV